MSEVISLREQVAQAELAAQALKPLPSQPDEVAEAETKLVPTIAEE